MNWYEKETGVFSPVISTRVRFARNLEGIPFPHRASETEQELIWNKVSEALAEKNMRKIPFEGQEKLVKESFVETRIASKNLLQKEKGAGLLLSPEGDVSIMVGEEDHIRLQVIKTGERISEALKTASDYAAFLEEKLPLAKRENLGYLTSCPTNLGSGCRISVMIHLPALSALGAIGSLVEHLGAVGYTVRGAFGEGSRSEEGILQISNQKRGNFPPEKIAEDFEEILRKIRTMEAEAGAKIYKEQSLEIRDRICRAVGTLRYAEKISYREFLTLFSLVRFGKALGLDTAREFCLPDRLLFELAPSPLVLSDLSLQDSEKRDASRALRIKGANMKKEE